jgi:hypothetical protein
LAALDDMWQLITARVLREQELSASRVLR